LSGKTKTLVASLAALSVMIGLVVASVPLYRFFCKVTGFGGTPRIVTTADAQVNERTVKIRFDANVMKGLPWTFKPNQTEMTVRLGEPNVATFTATNNAREAIIGTAAFNVTPAKAGIYVDKIACFCFTEQRLEAGQTVAEMPVQFYIDPAIATDPNTNDVTTITFSYSFYKSPQQAEGAS